MSLRGAEEDVGGGALRNAPRDLPFIIYALPRSRTAWMSAFLSYRDWQCSHDCAVQMRGWADVEAFFARPRHGSAETGVAPGWRLLEDHFPQMRRVVVLRDVEDVVRSCLAVPLHTIGMHYDEARLRRNCRYLARCLEQISARPGVLTLSFDELATAEGCRRLFEHCLPYAFDRGWWEQLSPRNIQQDVLAQLVYAELHRAKIEAFKRLCWRRLRAKARAGLQEAA